ncbi:MAG: BamA/TamA family outer membrane protein, partial [Acidobacteriota bacterium]
NPFAASVSQYRTLSGSYINLSKRLQYAVQGFSQTEFFYGYLPGLYYDPSYAFIDRDFAIATRTARGGSVYSIYPLNRYSRLELSAALYNFNEQYDDPTVAELAKQYEEQYYGTTVFNNGNIMPLGITFTNETTIFREFGPLAGKTLRAGYEIAPKIGGFLSRQTADLDARYYMRIGTTGLLALRGRGFKSWGDYPDFLYFGGNSEMRGYEYLEFLGHSVGFANAELRFPLIEAMATPIGVMGGIRGVFFFDIGGAALKGQPFTFATNQSDIVDTIAGWQFDPVTGGFVPIPGEKKQITGFRLVDGRASYGVGLETFALGFPIHFDWAWRTLFNKDWEDAVFAANGGSSWFRKSRFAVWIGYDF